MQNSGYYLVINPLFEEFLTESTKDEAIKIANYFVTMFLHDKMGLRKNTIGYYFSGDIEKLKSNFRLTKFKIFSSSGEIIFSSDPKEIGILNNRRYFHEIVAKG